MKALTLHQPWASLIAAGYKFYETRSWAAPPADWGTTIAIHAGAQGDQHFRNDPDVKNCLGTQLLPAKAIVAVVRLQDCARTETLEPSLLERRFGNYAPGRYAWRLTNVQPLTEPVPARGNRKLWTIPPEVIEDITSRLLPPISPSPDAQ